MAKRRIGRDRSRLGTILYLGTVISECLAIRPICQRGSRAVRGTPARFVREIVGVMQRPLLNSVRASFNSWGTEIPRVRRCTAKCVQRCCYQAPATTHWNGSKVIDLKSAFGRVRDSYGTTILVITFCEEGVLVLFPDGLVDYSNWPITCRMPPRQLRLHTLRLSALPFFRSLLVLFPDGLVDTGKSPPTPDSRLRGNGGQVKRVSGIRHIQVEAVLVS